MTIHPNLTKLRIRVLAIAPCPDGLGAEATAAVEEAIAMRNKSDFIRVKAGDTITFYTSEPGILSIDGRYEVEASLNADARGGRIVVRRVRPLVD